jgi:transposase
MATAAASMKAQERYLLPFFALPSPFFLPFEIRWYWLVDGLMAAGFAVHLANTSAIKQYEGLKYAGDERDAVFLAHIFRLGLLPEGYIYPPEERGLRDLARKRMQLVQQRTLNILSIENILARQLNLRLNAEQVRHLDNAAVTALHLPPHIECAVMANLAVMSTLQAQIHAIAAEFRGKIAPWNHVADPSA